MGTDMGTNGFAGDHLLKEPRVGGSVWPLQCCPVFTPRAAALPGERACWYCKYVDFHLKERRSLDVGICCWLKRQID
ncbi:MAG: hypothetical protein KHZ58_16800 [Hungatella hathewayi]|nr:hypothetical protein [Hungatella hathewayi]